jgi:ketosteroid isomerase-like protein
MDILQRFMAYAGDFEKTLADDDWTRLAGYFAEDAVYEVQGVPFNCRLVGRAAIFAGMKKSLDGFDRKFTGRDIEVTTGPDVAGDVLTAGWAVTYKKDDLAPLTVGGRSTARYRGGVIASLTDVFDPGVTTTFAAWQIENDLDLDPSYT